MAQSVIRVDYRHNVVMGMMTQCISWCNVYYDVIRVVTQRLNEVKLYADIITLTTGVEEQWLIANTDDHTCWEYCVLCIVKLHVYYYMQCIANTIKY